MTRPGPQESCGPEHYQDYPVILGAQGEKVERHLSVSVLNTVRGFHARCFPDRFQARLSGFNHGLLWMQRFTGSSWTVHRSIVRQPSLEDGRRSLLGHQDGRCCAPSMIAEVI